MNTRYRLASCILLLALWLFVSPRTARAEVVFADDFSGDMDKWQLAQGNEDTWWVNNGIMSGRLASRFKQAVIVPADHLWDESWINYDLSYRLLPVSGADKNIVFGYQDAGNWYELHLYPHGKEVVKVVDGQVVWQQQRAGPIINGRWYQVHISSQPGAVKIFLDDVQIFDIDDAAFSSGFARPGLKVTTGSVAPTEVYFDDFQISIDGENLTLPVERFAQNNQSWSLSEYDSASEWADDITISAWGCALTSAVMILQFHGFSSLPDGTFITPKSLNQWLLDQPDGYIGNGLVNWLAITRLTYLLSQQNGSYALEYRQHQPEIELIAPHLQNNNPVILQVPGHFMVGHGLTPDNDILIKDPAYSYSRFSQHQKELLSFRSFTPTNTDLSYLLINYQPEISLSLSKEAENIEVITTESNLQSAADQLALSPSLMQTEAAKPAPGIYSALVSQAEYGAATIEFFAYDQQGNPHSSIVEINAGPYQTELAIELTADYELKIEQLFDFEKMHSDLAAMKANDDLKTWRAFIIINNYMEYALEANNPTDQLRYIELMTRLINYYQDDFTSSAYLHLTENLDAFESRLESRLEPRLQESAV